MVKLNKAHRKWFEKNFEDFDKLDIKAEWDSSLSVQENKNILIDKFFPYYKKHLKEIEKAKFEEQQRIAKEEQELIEEWKKSKPERIDATGKLEIPIHYIKAVLSNEEVNLFTWIGAGGTGKTYITLNCVKEASPKWVYRNTHITPLELYKLFYYYREGHTIILDDVTELLTNEKSINILMAATWKAGKERIVTFDTSDSKLEGVPKNFAMKSNIIILNNEMRDKEKLKALKGRGFFYNLELTYKETLSLIKKIADNNKNEMSKKAYDLLRKETDFSTKDLNIRTFLKAIWCLKYDEKRAKELFIAGIETDERLKLIRELMKEYPRDVKGQINKFVENTGLGRATFFSFKKELKKQMGG